MTAVQITVFAKPSGLLTKRISLGAGGKAVSDGSACVMGAGTAARRHLFGAGDLAQLIDGLPSSEALALGRLRMDLPDQVKVTTRRKLNGGPQPDQITRTQDYLVYQRGEPAFALLDHDKKDMPPEVATRIEALGGFWPALISVIPGLDAVSRVERASTSAGLSRTDTSEPLSGSGGIHVYVLVQDGADIPRFLKALHERCWLVGLGWTALGAAGQLLDRSIIDRVVGTPERLVFEGAPVLVSPIVQDRASRRPRAIDGGALDTVAVCPPLTIVEQARLAELRAKEAVRLAPVAAKARALFITARIDQLIKAGRAASDARRIVEQQCDGILLPDLVLPFDNPELSGKTVANVLEMPVEFEGETLADPIEGPGYGPGKAKVLLRADSTPWIHSFAHGETVYELKLDFKAVKAALENKPTGEAADFFIRCLLAANLNEAEIAQLKEVASRRSGIGLAPLNAMIKRERKRHAMQQQEEERLRRLAERNDPRPQLLCPAPDAEWLPTVEAIDDVLGRSAADEPPMRDYEGFLTRCKMRRVMGLRAMTQAGANAEEAGNSALPSPEMLLLTRLDEIEAAECIERHIQYADAFGRLVHLPGPFVKHFLKRSDGTVPVVTSIVQLPIVLPNGEILTGHGLNRKYNAIFRVPAELNAYVPERRSCDKQACAAAMRFLTDEWLCDVATDYVGKCVIVACALTVIERALLAARPGFLFSAGKAGCGKSTLAGMISYATLGHAAAAAAWSTDAEERRKSLLGLLLEGVPLIFWDNIERGTTISCPHIERALTAELYSDRFLGTSERRSVQIDGVHVFTGNNISPRGDMCSRVLSVILSFPSADPENRDFKHLDPIGWTQSQRGEILRALYTILLGNPRRNGKCKDPPETRFKEWCDLVGSAVEYAAAAVCDSAVLKQGVPAQYWPSRIKFKRLFLDGAALGEEAIGMAELLVMLREQWRGPFRACDVAAHLAPELTSPTEDARAMQSALERASGKLLRKISATEVSWRLKAVTDAPTQTDEGLLELKREADRRLGDVFHVKVVA